MEEAGGGAVGGVGEGCGGGRKGGGRRRRSDGEEGGGVTREEEGKEGGGRQKMGREEVPQKASEASRRRAKVDVIRFLGIAGRVE